MLCIPKKIDVWLSKMLDDNFVGDRGRVLQRCVTWSLL